MNWNNAMTELSLLHKVVKIVGEGEVVFLLGCIWN